MKKFRISYGKDITMNQLFNGFEEIDENNVEKYNFAGVWAMFGVEKKNNPEKRYTCLNVGKNISIGEELRIDFERIGPLKECRKRQYRNQFNELKFDYPDNPNRQDYLYSEIYDKYEDITVILVAKQSEHTYTIEKYFAYSTKAIYWVSNGRYSEETKVSDEKIESIRSQIDVSSLNEDLVSKLDQFATKYKEQLK